MKSGLCREKMHEECLIEQKWNRTFHHVAAAGSNVSHQFEKRPMMLNVPDYIGQPDQHGDDETDPDPFVRQGAAFACEQESDDNSAAEKKHRPFVENANSGDHAKPNP